MIIPYGSILPAKLLKARSDPQIDLSDVFRVGKFLRASFTESGAALKAMDAIGDPSRRGRALLDKQRIR